MALKKGLSLARDSFTYGRCQYEKKARDSFTYGKCQYEKKARDSLTYGKCQFEKKARDSFTYGKCQYEKKGPMTSGPEKEVNCPQDGLSSRVPMNYSMVD